MTAYPDAFNLCEWLLEHNRLARPDKVAVLSERRDLTYCQVSDETAKVQAVLHDLGAWPEQRVLMVVPDVPEFVTTWLAVVRGGHVFAMVNPRLPTEDYAYYLEYSRAPVAVVHHDALEHFMPALPGQRWLRSVLLIDHVGELPVYPGVHFARYEEAVPAANAVAAADTHRDELCGWLFTSGTSGKPKAAMHFHGDFAFNIERYGQQVLGLGEDDVTMAVSKLFFGYATGTNLMFPFSVGAQTALFAERSTAEALVRHAARVKPTMLAAVPTTLNGLLRLEGHEVEQALDRLRFVISAGEALPAELLTSFMKRFGVEILDGIGSAEMFHIYITSYPGEVKVGSLGRLVPGYQARIVGADGQDVSHGDPGVLWVHGPSAAHGYWLAREKSRETFQGDWAITGDLFRQDPDGFFFYEGRADDMLKVGGIWVAPREVEECLLSHAEVEECCVVGWQNCDGLTVPLAWVVAADADSASDELTERLQTHVKQQLASYKFPRRLEYVASLPRNDRGKIARGELKSRAAGLGA